MSDHSDIFADVAEADVTGGADRARPGKYVFDVKDLTFEDKRKGPAFIANLIVVKSTAKEVDEKGVPIPPTLPGVTVGLMACFWGNMKDAAPGLMKGYISAIFGKDPRDVPGADIKDALKTLFKGDGPKAQPARGRRVYGETRSKVVDGETRVYLNLSPAPASENTDALVAERRKALE